MSLLDYVLPQVAKLSKTLQTEKLDVTVISSLVEATLYSIDDALTPAANWVLALQDMEKSWRISKTSTGDFYAEWTTFHHYIAKEDMSSQLYVLSTNEMLRPMFPNLHSLVNVCMSVPVGTASVERSFSKMKMIKTWRLRNRLSEKVFPT